MWENLWIVGETIFLVNPTPCQNGLIQESPFTLKPKDKTMNKDWQKYNQACKQLVVAFLKRYYPEESLDTVYFIGREDDYSNVFECCDRFYDIDFVQECLKLDATFEDIASYQDYGLECSFHDREVGINLENWVKHPELRKKPEEQPFTIEEQLRQLLKKCIPALEGITQYENLLADINKLAK